jgi:hypothetical protein
MGLGCFPIINLRLYYTPFSKIMEVKITTEEVTTTLDGVYIAKP